VYGASVLHWGGRHRAGQGYDCAVLYFGVVRPGAAAELATETPPGFEAIPPVALQGLQP